MYALDKQRFIKIIEVNFENDEAIFKDDWRLEAMWKQ